MHNYFISCSSSSKYSVSKKSLRVISSPSHTFFIVATVGVVFLRENIFPKVDCVIPHISASFAAEIISVLPVPAYSAAAGAALLFAVIYGFPYIAIGIFGLLNNRWAFIVLEVIIILNCIRALDGIMRPQNIQTTLFSFALLAVYVTLTVFIHKGTSKNPI